MLGLGLELGFIAKYGLSYLRHASLRTTFAPLHCG